MSEKVKIVSLAPVRRQPAGDLRAATARASDSLRNTKDVRVKEPLIVDVGKTRVFCDSKNFWNQNIPLTLKTAAQILTRGVPRGIDIGIRFLEKEDGYPCLDFSSSFLFGDKRYFEPSRARVLPGVIKVFEREAGLGRILMRNEIEFFHACGFRTFDIEAGMGAGGYTWARMGFLPGNVNSSDFEERTREKVRSRFNLLARILTPHEKAKIKAVIALRQPTDVWKVADLDSDLAPRLRDVFEERGMFFNQLAEEYYRLKWPETWEGIEEAVNKGRKLTLGRMLLAGAFWKGTLDMNDSTQMQRVADYSGGFKYIGFTKG